MSSKFIGNVLRSFRTWSHFLGRGRDFVEFDRNLGKKAGKKELYKKANSSTVLTSRSEPRSSCWSSSPGQIFELCQKKARSTGLVVFLFWHFAETAGENVVLVGVGTFFFGAWALRRVWKDWASGARSRATDHLVSSRRYPNDRRA